ncbi:rhodanese-like domain-containing protein [Gaiella sp.]|uniref:rhodanese-like domain-containing protein n=1 Tax=Gaiella sp. TaxID=2663207 RepID=UPI003982FABB
MGTRVFERRTLAELLAEAEGRISRLSPSEAQTARENGALLIDIRSDSNRFRDGIVPGSLHIPRTVLEWRTAPESEFRNPYVDDLDHQIILLCDHGCSSVLAAAVLKEFGYLWVGDVIGGFSDWRDAGLPVGRARRRRSRPDKPAGMGPPDP